MPVSVTALRLAPTIYDILLKFPVSVMASHIMQLMKLPVFSEPIQSGNRPTKARQLRLSRLHHFSPIQQSLFLLVPTPHQFVLFAQLMQQYFPRFFRYYLQMFLFTSVVLFICFLLFRFPISDFCFIFYFLQILYTYRFR